MLILTRRIAMRSFLAQLTLVSRCGCVALSLATLGSQVSAAVLYDQDNNAGGNNIASQDFEAGFNAFDCQAYDDFIVPPGDIWSINTVFVRGVYSVAGPAPIVRVQFYADAGGSPGALINSVDIAVFTDAAGDFTIPIPPQLLPAGHYWVSVIAVMDFGTSGQWFWRGRLVQSNAPAHWANPGDGFGTGCTAPTPAQTCIPVFGPDALFRLEGDNVRPQDRVSATEKGSVLIFSKVELKWDVNGALVQDTFIQITNDNNAGTNVQLYFVNGDPPLAAIPAGQPGGPERAHPGWNNIDNAIFLTANQPSYWSALTGQPGSPFPPPSTGPVSPFTVLDPGIPPGRPDPDSPTSPDRVLRGFIVAFAINPAGEEIKWNHLFGNATLVNYRDGTAWEYNAWSFQAVDPMLATGAQTGTPGIIALDGVEFAPAFDQLLFNFVAVGSSAFSSLATQVVATPDLTLHHVYNDLRENTIGPRTTKAKFDIWNQNEVKFSGAERCLTCWDQRLLGNWAPLANHFLRPNLQTNVGKARVNGENSPVVCPTFPNNGAYPLLGVIATRLSFDGGLRLADAGTNLHGMGTENAVMYFDISPPTQPATSDDVENGQIDSGLSILDNPREAGKDEMPAAIQNNRVKH
jgi:hypothetical protein